MMNKRGVTLVELVIMIAVGSILLMGMSKSSLSFLKRSVDARNMTIALNLAKRQMAIMNNTAYASLPVAAEAALSVDAAFPGFTPTQEVTSVAVSGAESIRRVIVRVRLGSSAGAVLVMLDTYRTSIVTFGNGT